MVRCEHGQKITKFCINEHCHHKESAGCEYCIRKYHFHLNSTLLLTQADVDNLIKNLTLPTDIKFRSRNLQQIAIDYFESIRNCFNKWIDQAQNQIADRLAHPTLRKQGFLNTYNKLKQKQYRKVNAKELRSINQFSKSVTPVSLKKQEISNYYEEVDWTMDIISAVEKVLVQITRLPEVKEGEGKIHVVSKSKLKQVYKSIKLEKERRDLCSKRGGVSGKSKSQGHKIQKNTFVQKLQASEQLTNEFTQIFDRKVDNEITEQAEKPNFLLENEELINQPQTYNQTIQMKEKIKRRLRRRKSSLDEKKDFKFRNTNQNRSMQANQAQQKTEEKTEQGQVVKNAEKRQISKRVREVENNVINLLNFSNQNQWRIEQQQNCQNQAVSKQTLDIKKLQEIDFQKYEQSIDKALYNNYLGDVINNYALPPRPSTPINDLQEIIKQKVVKIPITDLNQHEYEIQSPIFKSRRRQQNNVNNTFELVLTPTAAGEVIQNKDENILKPIEQTHTANQSSVPEVSVPVKMQKTKDIFLYKDEQQEDDLIVLQQNQKNSLLLLCQALKSPADRAINLLRASLKYSPLNLSAAQYLSYLYLQAGQPKQCIGVCQLILFQIKNTPQEFQLTLHLHNNKAAALIQLGRYSEAIMILQKCLRFRRKHHFYKNLGDAYFCLGIPQKAAMNYQKAVKLDGQSDEAFYNLAVTYFFQQQYISAQINIKQALRLEPLNQTYMHLSQQISKRKGNLAL